MSKGTKEKLLKTLKIFHKLGIEVIPNYNVREGSNNKSDFIPIDGWKNISYSYKENIKAVEDGVIGFIVRAGIKSNISVVDYDFHSISTTNNTNILDRLKAVSTFYTNTPSGGYHFYFKYHKGIVKNRLHLFNNIDLRSEGTLLYLGVRNDGEYSIHYEDALILKLPNDIFKELYEWQKPTKEISYINTKKENIEEQTFNNIQRFIKGIRYNILDIQLYKYLYDLPTEYLDDTIEWKSITFILKKYGYRDIWDKWSKHSKYYNKDGNNKIWNSMSIDKTIADLNHIISILNETTYSDNKIIHIRKIYKEYNILNPINLKRITLKINIQYLDKSIYENGEDTVVQSPMNTKKSRSNVQNAKENNQIYFSIVALTSTQESHYNSFKNAGIKSFSYKNVKELYKDFQFIKDDDTTNNEDESSDNDLNKIDDDINLNDTCIFTTIDSLLLFKDKSINFQDRIIYLDEIHSLFLYLLRCDNLSKKRMEIFAFLIKILKECKQIIVVDSDICNNTITLLNLLGRKPFQFIVNTYKSYKDIKGHRINDMIDMIKLIKQDVDNKEFNISCCNTKTLADKVEQILLSLGVSPFQILKYTSKSGKQIQNINEEWKDKYIIYSPSIVAGLDFTPLKAINTYSYVDGINTLNPEQIGQQICRNRNIKNVYLHMINITNVLIYEDMDALKTHYKNEVLSHKSSASF